MADQGLILVDKPSGITSFDVIRRLRKEFTGKAPKMGHAGTLDPLASGLMLVGVGVGTKELANLIKLDKVYEAEVQLGIRTDSGDVTGEVLEQDGDARSLCPSKEQLEKLAKGLVGVHSLAVPIYSAIKRNGKKLYELARAGGTVEEIKPPVKPMEIYSAKLLSEAVGGKFSIELHVSSGTYIRSIVEEIGNQLGVPATLSGLRRTRIGKFDVKDARKI